MTDQYTFNPDIHDDWEPPAHRCGNCAHHEHEVVPVQEPDGEGNLVDTGREFPRCWCGHDGKHFATNDNNHCDFWEAEE